MSSLWQRQVQRQLAGESVMSMAQRVVIVFAPGRGSGLRVGHACPCGASVHGFVVPGSTWGVSHAHRAGSRSVRCHLPPLGLVYTA